MANIRIEEKKKSGSILPWIIGLLVLALAVWGITELFDEGDHTELDLVEEGYIDEVDDEVAEVGADIDDAYLSDFNAYMDYTTDMEGQMGLDHEFSHKAISLLASAASSVAESRNVMANDAQSKAQRAMQLADDITKDPYATDHADKIRMAALMITDILENVDNESFNGANRMEITKLRKEAQDITAETLTLNQKEDVRSFFATARNVLSRMS